MSGMGLAPLAIEKVFVRNAIVPRLCFRIDDSDVHSVCLKGSQGLVAEWSNELHVGI
ncbi:hypothetical protein E4U21_005496, partial [Claviceps maximensis]